MQSKSALPQPGGPHVQDLQGHNRWLGIPIVGWVILFAIAVNLPFVNQPYHMDDGVFLLIARNVQHNPWFPQDFPFFFEGLYASDLASGEHAWPLTSYIAALISLVGGYKEAWLHLGFLLFPVLLAWGMYSLSADLTRLPALATVTLLMLPVVVVSSHTLMTDIPLLALWLTAVVLFRRGIASGSAGPLWAGSLVAALACAVTYSGLCVVVLLLLYALLRRKPTAALAIVLVPVGALAVLFSAHYLHYHRFTPAMLVDAYLSAKRVLASELVFEKSMFAILALGAVTVSPLFAALSNGYKVNLGTLAAAIWCALVLPQCSNYSAGQKALFILFCWAGLCVLARVVGQLLQGFGGLRSKSELNAENLFLGMWVLGVVIFCIAVHMTGSARHLLPAMPALVLILFRHIEQRWGHLARRLAVANLALCALIASVLSLADYEFATIYRDFTDTISRSLLCQSGKVWFTGEWGFRAYLEQAGGQELGRRDPRAGPGDILVVPTLATPYLTLYSDKLSLPSIALVAPSSIGFPIPPVPSGGVLVYTSGMPFHEASDGVQFVVRFLSRDADQVLSDERIDPQTGRRWQAHELLLPETARQGGTILLEARVGAGGDADADWLAIARVRITIRTDGRERTLYDFREHLNEAQITPVPGFQYHTKGNVPAFPMNVWLEQVPATILLGTHTYRPRIPIRLLDSGSHAGFWSSGWGLLPYSFAATNTVLETISVYEVTRDVDSYGERPVSWFEK